VTRNNDELIGDALNHIAALRRHLERGDLADETVADAVSLRLAAAIEALSDLEPEVREHLFGEEWKVIWATRNRIAHGYAFVDLSVIQDTVENDLPAVHDRLSNYRNGRKK
jgi:uncharacterized protein with HEPN domain